MWGVGRWVSVWVRVYMHINAIIQHLIISIHSAVMWCELHRIYTYTLICSACETGRVCLTVVGLGGVTMHCLHCRTRPVMSSRNGEPTFGPKLL